ncbi:MAG: methyltransferase domain-containing protein [Gemmatimonadales bacterium]|nr:methyltransferase domain-containing protein [Gemmatimonadales bacterium]
MDAPILSREYDNQYRRWREHLGPSAGDLEWRLDHLLWRHRVLLRRYPTRNKRVLDFGCMDGVLTIALHRAGAHATGYDIAPAAIAQARSWTVDTGRPEFISTLPDPGQFDIVFCCEVIEHIPDDRGFAGTLTTLLAPGGRLVGTTPVGRCFWDPDHKRAYDAVTLRAALEPWGRVRIRRYYRTPIRNLLPIRQRGAAIFIFEVTPPPSSKRG